MAVMRGAHAAGHRRSKPGGGFAATAQTTAPSGASGGDEQEVSNVAQREEKAKALAKKKAAEEERARQVEAKVEARMAKASELAAKRLADAEKRSEAHKDEPSTSKAAAPASAPGAAEPAAPERGATKRVGAAVKAPPSAPRLTGQLSAADAGRGSRSPSPVDTRGGAGGASVFAPQDRPNQKARDRLDQKFSEKEHKDVVTDLRFEPKRVQREAVAERLVAEAEEASLETTFEALCVRTEFGEAAMGKPKFGRLLGSLQGQFNGAYVKADADWVFSKVCPRHRKTINFEEFERALAKLAVYKGFYLEDLRAAVVAAIGVSEVPHLNPVTAFTAATRAATKPVVERATNAQRKRAGRSEEVRFTPPSASKHQLSLARKAKEDAKARAAEAGSVAGGGGGGRGGSKRGGGAAVSVAGDEALARSWKGRSALLDDDSEEGEVARAEEAAAVRVQCIVRGHFARRRVLQGNAMARQASVLSGATGGEAPARAKRRKASGRSARGKGAGGKGKDSATGEGGTSSVGVMDLIGGAVGEEGKLRGAVTAFASFGSPQHSEELCFAKFSKLCNDIGIVDSTLLKMRGISFTRADVNEAFAKFTPATGRRRMGFADFERCLSHLADKVQLERTQLVELIHSAAPELSSYDAEHDKTLHSRLHGERPKRQEVGVSHAAADGMASPAHYNLHGQLAGTGAGRGKGGQKLSDGVLSGLSSHELMEAKEAEMSESFEKERAGRRQTANKQRLELVRKQREDAKRANVVLMWKKKLAELAQSPEAAEAEAVRRELKMITKIQAAWRGKKARAFMLWRSSPEGMAATAQYLSGAGPKPELLFARMRPGGAGKRGPVKLGLEHTNGGV